MVWFCIIKNCLLYIISRNFFSMNPDIYDQYFCENNLYTDILDPNHHALTHWGWRRKWFASWIVWTIRSRPSQASRLTSWLMSWTRIRRIRSCSRFFFLNSNRAGGLGGWKLWGILSQVWKKQVWIWIHPYLEPNWVYNGSFINRDGVMPWFCPRVFQTELFAPFCDIPPWLAAKNPNGWKSFYLTTAK